VGYQPKTYRDNGGDRIMVATGGEIDIATGCLKINGTAVTLTAAQINAAGGASSGTTTQTFTVDNDCATGKFILSNTAGGTNHTITLAAPAPAGANAVLTLPNTTGTLALTSDTATNLDLGASGTPGSLDIFPATLANGKLTLSAANMGGAWNMGITNAAIAAARAYVIPDAGGDGRFVMTTGANSLLVNCNSGDRTMSMAGNVTLAGALTTTGAFATTFAIPAAHTYTFPNADCTLASDTGGSTGTTSSTFTVDSDAATGKFVVRPNAVGGTDHTVTLTASTTTQAVTLTLPDIASDTLVSKTSTDVLTNKTLTAPVINGITTAAAANNFTLNTGSGAFTTPTGTFTHYGNVAVNGNKTFDFSSSSGTFATSTGTNTLGGAVVIAANKGLSLAAGNGAVDCSGSSGAFSTTAGLCTFYGGVANNGANNWDLSTSSGTFKTPTGTNTLGGNTVIAAGKTLTIGTGTGGVANGLTIFSATSTNGSVVIHQPDNAGNKKATFQPDAALAQNTTYQFPDPGGANGEVVVTTGSFQCLVNCNAADRTVSLTGNLVFPANFTSGAHAITLTTGGTTTLTLPTSGTVATIGGTETLTGKAIDGDDNTLTDISPTVAKAGIANSVAALPVVIQFSNTGAETQAYTVPAGKTLRVLDAVAYKTSTAGGAADTVQLKNVATAITDAISLNVADKTRAVPTTWDDAQYNIAAGTALNCVTVQGTTDACCYVVVTGMWV